MKKKFYLCPQCAKDMIHHCKWPHLCRWVWCRFCSIITNTETGQHLRPAEKEDRGT